MGPELPLCIGAVPLLVGGGAALWAHMKALAQVSLERAEHYALISGLSLGLAGAAFGASVILIAMAQSNFDLAQAGPLPVLCPAAMGLSGGLMQYAGVMRSVGRARKAVRERDDDAPRVPRP